MNRHSLLTSSALLGIALISGSVLAQQPTTLRQQVVGTWEIVSTTPPNVLLGTNPKGHVVLAASGRYVAVLAKADRPKNAGRADGIFAGFGTWSVNEADKTLTGHVDGNIVSSTEGTESKVTISLNGDEMRRTNPETKTSSVWKRVPQLQGLTGRKQQLVGTWEIVSATSTRNAGANPKGYLVLAGSGRYFTIAKNADRPKTTERTGDGLAANTGSWSLNGEEVTLHVETAMTTEIEGTCQTRCQSQRR